MKMAICSVDIGRLVGSSISLAKTTNRFQARLYAALVPGAKADEMRLVDTSLRWESVAAAGWLLGTCLLTDVSSGNGGPVDGTRDQLQHYCNQGEILLLLGN